ncbi:MAG: hypothetical protein QOJ60_2637 [Actinomycetota bacterium]|nr:hypothetical protein [Actinomycetota bacterium]
MELAVQVRESVHRLRAGWRPLTEATLAATAAWFLDADVIGHPQPFFAPAAALIVLGQARGQRVLRALEVVLGVAGGVLVADLVARGLGPGSTLTIFTVTAATLGFAIAVGASSLFRVQAAVSALYVAVVSPPGNGLVPYRFVDALVGGGIALLVNQASRPGNPLASVAERSRAALEGVGDVLRACAAALEDGEYDAARAALARARGLDEMIDELRETLASARELLLVDVHRRARLSRVFTIETATSALDHLVRNVRVLVRASVVLTRFREPAPGPLLDAVRLLAESVRRVEEALIAELAGDKDTVALKVDAAESAALQAVQTGAGLLPSAPPLPVVMIVGQIRMAAVDLLRAVGRDDTESLGRVDQALGLPPS